MTEIKKKRLSQDAGMWGMGYRSPRGNFDCEESEQRKRENESNKIALWPGPKDQIQFYQDIYIKPCLSRLCP